LLWGWQIDHVVPDRFDIIGADRPGWFIHHNVLAPGNCNRVTGKEMSTPCNYPLFLPGHLFTIFTISGLL